VLATRPAEDEHGWEAYKDAFPAGKNIVESPRPAEDAGERPTTDCRHPADQLADHADNPSRFRCRRCGSVLVDYGDGLGFVNRSDS
jgi:hypothetical protein